MAIGHTDTKTSSLTMDRYHSFKLWLRRLGIGGFLFFLIKGLVWVAIFAGLGKCAL